MSGVDSDAAALEQGRVSSLEGRVGVAVGG